MLDVLHVYRVSDVVGAEVRFLEHGEDALDFEELGLDFFDTLFPGDECFLNDLKSVSFGKKFLILEFEVFFDDFERST